MPTLTLPRLGDLTERVTFQQATGTPDGQGGASAAWAALGTVWAQVAALTGREALQASAVRSSVTYLVRIQQQRVGGQTVTAKLRITWTASYDAASTRTLEVLAVRPLGRDWIELDCGEVL